MYINSNSMATNVTNNLTSHYNDLKTSTSRLSSGLRVNSAADDAAGLAIRELMRTDIAALQQGVRNANDAISLIQTADGALAVIDEKLTRMKELAEQAANTPEVLVYLLVGIGAFAGAFLLNELISRISILRWCVLGIKKEKNHVSR